MQRRGIQLVLAQHAGPAQQLEHVDVALLRDGAAIWRLRASSGASAASSTCNSPAIGGRCWIVQSTLPRRSSAASAWRSSDSIARQLSGSRTVASRKRWLTLRISHTSVPKAPLRSWRAKPVMLDIMSNAPGYFAEITAPALTWSVPECYKAPPV